MHKARQRAEGKGAWQAHKKVLKEPLKHAKYLIGLAKQKKEKCERIERRHLCESRGELERKLNESLLTSRIELISIARTLGTLAPSGVNVLLQQLGTAANIAMGTVSQDRQAGRQHLPLQGLDKNIAR